MQSIRIPIRQSLSYRQTRNTVIVAFSIGLILSSTQIYLDYFTQKSEMRTSVRNVVATANRAAYHAAFNLDETGAMHVTRGLVSNQPIVQATIKDNSEQILGAAQSSGDDSISAASRWLFGPPQTISLELFNAAEYNEPVGELMVVVDPALNASTFVQRSTVVFLSGILRNFILALCLITVFYYTITRSILQASLPIQQGITDKRIPLPKNHANDEIGILITAFNDHLAIIQEQHEQIVDANVNLENLVAERTRQLAEKNLELGRERELALEGSQAKSDFLAMMSHEIRTPMHGILGMAELLSRDATAPKQKDYIDAILDSSKSLLTLMNSVLDYSKYEQGNLGFEHIPFDVNRLVNGIIFLLSPSAEKKHTLLTASFEEALPHYLVGDQEKLRQVLLNLLTNAIKFTEQGEVSLRVQRAEPGTKRPDDSVRLHFEIVDTGVGISENAKSTLFDAFSQADSSISRRFGGTGMGLAICRQIVEKQGGKIDFESTENHGSRFWFQLDFPVGDAPREATELSSIDTIESIASMSILVVDDVAINRKLLEGQLSSEHHRVLSASNGQEALELLSDNSIDLILMDLHMPVMDGLEASSRIRALNDNGKRETPIIGITANLSTASEQACLDSGMNLVITKPVNHQKLSASIRTVLDSRPEQEAPPAREASHDYLDAIILRQHRDALGEERVESLYVDAIDAIRCRVQSITASDLQMLDQMESEAHALAGLCANFGLHALGDISSAIEGFAQRKQASNLPGRINEIGGVAERTISDIESTLGLPH